MSALYFFVKLLVLVFRACLYWTLQRPYYMYPWLMSISDADSSVLCTINLVIVLYG